MQPPPATDEQARNAAIAHAFASNIPIVPVGTPLQAAETFSANKPVEWQPSPYHQNRQGGTQPMQQVPQRPQSGDTQPMRAVSMPASPYGMPAVAPQGTMLSAIAGSKPTLQSPVMSQPAAPAEQPMPGTPTSGVRHKVEVMKAYVPGSKPGGQP
jgi:hypothetical protein